MAHPRRRRLLCQIFLPIAGDRRIIDMRDQPVPAVIGTVVFGQPVAHRVLSGGLQLRVQAGMHDQPALHGFLLSELLRQRRLHGIGKIAGIRHFQRGAAGMRQ